MKSIVLIGSVLLLFSCASGGKKEKSPKEQVEGLQKMCKEAAPAIAKRQKEKSLYLRLGSRKGITKFVDKLYLAHKNNKQIGHMFKNVPAKSFKRNVVDFLTVGTGGKGKYKGRSMKNVHANLGITNADFLAAGGDVDSAMKELNHGENEIQEVVCALVSFIPVVVTK